MLWLDSVYPTDSPSTKPGAARGSCDISSGVPSDVESNDANAHVIFSNIKVGPIGSTFNNGGGAGSNPGGPTSATTPTSTTSGGGSSNTGVAQHWAQCGGKGWTGPTKCASGYTCQKVNDYYSQCL